MRQINESDVRKMKTGGGKGKKWVEVYYVHVPVPYHECNYYVLQTCI